MGACCEVSILCRDCHRLYRGEQTPERCPSCASPRLVAHRELAELTIAHIDCDAFYAAIEKRDDPSLADKPVIVGGGRRGVVSTCCYIARIAGVRSAMPMFKARRLCPHAVVIAPDMAKYARIGAQIRRMMKALTPLVEPVSIDEAFLDLAGTHRLRAMTPAQQLSRLASDIEREIGITVSIGLAANKFLAKLASDMDKPRGFSTIGAQEATAVLAELPVSAIWGVGKALQKRLAGDGLTRIAQLQRADEADLMRRYGVIGKRLYHLARGHDERPVQPNGQAKSLSAETTFSRDIARRSEIEKHLWRLSAKVARRAKRAGLGGLTVTLKLKTARFRTITRSHTLDDATQLGERIFAVVRHLLGGERDGESYRLCGVGLSQLTPMSRDPAFDDLDPATVRQARLEQAVDDVNERFGRQVVDKGRGLV